MDTGELYGNLDSSHPGQTRPETPTCWPKKSKCQYVGNRDQTTISEVYLSFLGLPYIQHLPFKSNLFPLRVSQESRRCLLLVARLSSGTRSACCFLASLSRQVQKLLALHREALNRNGKSFSVMTRGNPFQLNGAVVTRSWQGGFIAQEAVARSGMILLQASRQKGSVSPGISRARPVPQAMVDVHEDLSWWDGVSYDQDFIHQPPVNVRCRLQPPLLPRLGAKSGWNNVLHAFSSS